MLQFGASLTYDTSSVNYDCNMFIIWPQISHQMGVDVPVLSLFVISNIILTEIYTIKAKKHNYKLKHSKSLPTYICLTKSITEKRNSIFAYNVFHNFEHFLMPRHQGQLTLIWLHGENNLSRVCAQR